MNRYVVEKINELRASFDGQVYVIAVLAPHIALVLAIPEGAESRSIVNPLGATFEVDDAFGSWTQLNDPFIMRIEEVTKRAQCAAPSRHVN